MTPPAIQRAEPTAPQPRTVLDDLVAALTGPATHRGHALFTLLESQRRTAAGTLADIRGPLVLALRRHPEPARALQGRERHADDLLIALIRGLVNAPGTCARISTGTHRPILAAERRQLEYPVHIAVTRMGLTPDEVTIRTLTTAGVAAFARALRDPRPTGAR